MRPPGSELCGAYVVAVSVIAHVLVVVCSACAGVIWVDVIKRCIAACTYAWVRRRYGEYNPGCRVQVGCKAS